MKAPSGIRTDEASVLLPLLVLLLSFMIQHAWISDDAFITLRVVSNYVDGYGLRWNVGERVQVFTHPLWLLLLIPFYFVTLEPFFTTMIVSLCVAFGGVLCWLRMGARSIGEAAWLIVVLAGSVTFLDFSTSGLENPLSHFVCILFCYYFLQVDAARRLPALILLFSFSAVVRPDLVLVTMPGLLWTILRERPSFGKLTRLAPYALPSIMWFGFATIYYGSPLPNTFLAKVAAPSEHVSLFAYGIEYLLTSWRRDPLSLSLILAASIGSVASRETLPLMIGAVSYLAYIVSIGGDFMAGRFVSVPFVVSCICLTRTIPFDRKEVLVSSVLATMTLGIQGHLWTAPKIGPGEARVVDERSYYFPKTSLLEWTTEGGPATYPFAQTGTRARLNRTKVYAARAIGLLGYYAGPSVHVIDVLALSDPLLARLAPIPDAEFRPGHLPRPIPPGYPESIVEGRNVIREPNSARLYDLIRLVSQGPIFSMQRFEAIVGLLRGRAAIPPVRRELTLEQVPKELAVGDSTLDPRAVIFDSEGLAIRVKQESPARSASILLGGTIEYRFTVISDGAPLPSVEIRKRGTGGDRFETYSVELPQAARIDSLEVVPLSGDGFYSFGGVVVSE